MIDDNKIAKAAFDLYQNSRLDFVDSNTVEGFKEGAKWMREELLKDLWHDVSEEPKDLEYIVTTSEIFGEIYFFTVQRDNSKQSWETEVKCHGFDSWAYRNDIVSLILKGGNHD